MTNRLWLRMTDGTQFRIELPKDADIVDLKKAIKGELPIRFQAIDAPSIVVRNRSGDEIEGSVPVSAYFASPDYFDDYSLGSVEHPYTVDAPLVGWQFDCVLTLSLGSILSQARFFLCNSSYLYYFPILPPPSSLALIYSFCEFGPFASCR